MTRNQLMQDFCLNAYYIEKPSLESLSVRVALSCQGAARSSSIDGSALCKGKMLLVLGSSITAYGRRQLEL